MPLTFSQSLGMFDNAIKYIPSGTQTFSKGWTQYPFGVSPIFLDRADGCFVWDVDGNKFIDWPMALGPIILGHNNPKVNEAVKSQIDKGVAFSLPHHKEIELAEKLCETIPCAEMVRFGKNGSDATSGAVRIARAYTGRTMIACCGYHGWQDWYIGTTTRNLGVPKAIRELTVTFEYNNPASLENLFTLYPDQISCVILEPVSLVPPEDNFLERINKIAHKNGALVIYDECWTGFRWALGGAQEFFGITPDLACFGKALGNGFPISVIVGRSNIMKTFDEIFYSFTFGGDLVGITAGLTVIKELVTTNAISHIWKMGNILIDGVSILLKKYDLEHRIHLKGYPPKTFMFFTDKHGNDDLLLKSIVQQEMIKRGILYAGYHIISFSHTENEINQTLNAYDQIFSLIKNNDESKELKSLLKGKIVESVFRKH